MTIDWRTVSVDFSVAEADDVRLGHLVESSSWDQLGDDRRIVLLGFPSDEGVRRNGGRAGAADGCDRIRHWLYRMTPDASSGGRHHDLLRQVTDIGNLVCRGDLERDQRRLGRVIASLLESDRIPIILGGGHETALGHFLGYAESGMPVSIVNVDAHADVRPLVDGRGHSGSPFRQALEHPGGACRGYRVLGLSRFATAASHVEYLRRHEAAFCWSDELRLADAESAFDGDERVLATFDLDVLSQHDAPGVSAPNPLGIDRTVWLALARSAGRSPSVRSMDVVELNPRYDRDDATARLAALTVWQFTRGLADRNDGRGGDR